MRADLIAVKKAKGVVMKDIESRISKLKQDKSELEDKLAQHESERAQLIELDGEQAIQAMMDAKEHEPDARICEHELQIAAAQHKLTIMEEALNRLDGELAAKQEAVHIENIRKLDKKGLALRKKYDAAVLQLHNIMKSIHSLEAERINDAYFITRARGLRFGEPCTDADAENIRAMLNASSFTKEVRDSNQQKAILQGRAVEGYEVARHG